MRINSNITDAEWQIMRIIWANDKTTSNQIIQKLSTSKNWSPTTVKTLLARLLKKNIIAYKKSSRAREYYPLVTEQDCVKNEMNSVIKRLYGGVENLRTEHFVFYGDDKSEYISLLAEELENNHSRILDSLEYTLDDELMVYTHETQQHLHSALGQSNGPKWLRGGWAWDVIHMAPEECFDDIKPERAAVHIFAQIVISSINRRVPYWLMQGAAAFLGRWLEPERVRRVISGYPDITFTSFEQISTDYEMFKDKGGYEIAYTVADFIVSKFTYNHLVKFIKSPEDYEDIFTCTKEKFWEQWFEFLNSKYREEN